jgi:hypothetical protein
MTFSLSFSIIFLHFFFSLIGPYYADGDHNDEMLWNYIVEENEGEITDTFTVGEDEFIADRGFLRCRMDDDAYLLHCPKPLATGKNQYTCEEANYSRKVTRIRCVSLNLIMLFIFYFILFVFYLFFILFFYLFYFYFILLKSVFLFCIGYWSSVIF